MRVFRPATERAATANLARTLVQTTFFWTVFIVVLPYAIHVGETRLGIPGFSFPGQQVVAAIVFGAMTVLHPSTFTPRSRGSRHIVAEASPRPREHRGWVSKRG